jgi:hypothetical protein
MALERPTFTALALEGNITGVEDLLRNPNYYTHIENVERGIGPDGRAMTALGIAAWRGNTPMMQLLLSQGAEVDGTGPDGAYPTATPLFAAVRGGHRCAVNMLVQNGADVNSSQSMHHETGGGATVMYYAAKYNDLRMAMLLHTNGACLYIPTGAGDMPIDIAKSEHSRDVINWIERVSTYYVRNMNGGYTKYRIAHHPYATNQRDRITVPMLE